MRVLLALLLATAIGGCNNYGTLFTQPPQQDAPTVTADAGAPPDMSAPSDMADGSVAQNDGGSGEPDAACTSVCTGKICGTDDGCGTACGEGSGCTPACTSVCVGKTCGSDDGCGTTCQEGSGCGCPLPPVDDPDPKVTLCHLPPGNPLNCHTLHVGSQNAANAHVAHGDYLGDCRPGCL